MPKFGDIQINQGIYRINFSWTKKLAKILQKKYKLRQNISLALVGDKTIQKYNAIYRQKNKVTDVLSFNLPVGDFLGEILICVPQARRQARADKKPLLSEIKFLVVHGALHLLGFDHEKNNKEKMRQEKAEQAILKLL